MSEKVSEIRRDPVSRDWVVIAKGRAKRPNDFKKNVREKEVTDVKECPFCRGGDAFDNLKGGKNEIVATIKNRETDDAWWVATIKNLYPAVDGNTCDVIDNYGPYEVQPGSGYHEVVLTRDHSRSIAEMSQEEVETLIRAYEQRYEELREKNCANYILIFHNHGKEAGASLFHPHSQIIAIPVIPADVRRSLEGSERYSSKTNGECIHCEMLRWEMEQKKRIVFENETMLVVSPYVPRTSFELRIYPKNHQPHFEKINEQERTDLAEALRITLGKLYVGLNNPAYNFYIHTTPVEKDGKHSYYHWHLEILPKNSIWGGFELGTGVEISAVDPDDAAEYLKDMSLPTSK